MLDYDVPNLLQHPSRSWICREKILDDLGETDSVVRVRDQVDEVGAPDLPVGTDHTHANQPEGDQVSQTHQ
ncbi:MAG: hypothetical protein EHM71_15410 [Zetaproteobacteria bacterium]|nr:MAG: hypothetical protein EHM71_15410 [Zetaproteobacteria bacterium]